MKITFFCLAMLVAFCSFFSLKKGHFQVLESTSQQWHAGIPSGGSGTEYAFRMVISGNEPVRFDSVWLSEKAFRVQVVKGNMVPYGSTFKRGDTLLLRVSDNRPGKMPGPAGAAASHGAVEADKVVMPPMHYKGEALLRYYAAGKPHYFTFTGIKKLPPQNMP
jgi:hypothetical protein